MDKRDRSRSRSPERNDGPPPDQYQGDSEQKAPAGEDPRSGGDSHHPDDGGQNNGDSNAMDGTGEEVKLYVGNLDYGMCVHV
mmetsp:Transcript_29116/g.67519  ORF Transcript_29116/g.67519 Transcript_29116/m.67519 type:complete len:82 (-) Transcript_29116:1969-2214(-)